MADNTELEDIEYLDVNLDETEKELTEDDFFFGTNSDNMDVDKRKKNRAEMKHQVAKEIYTYIIIVVAAVLIAIAFNKFVIINAHVPTPSMSPNISVGDKLIGNRLAYLFKNPERGDIVIFKFPDDEKQIFIKRIIGLPGDTVQIVEGELFINGEIFIEDYIKDEMRGNFGPYEVPKGYYFVLGDNRNISEDSRFWRNTYVSRKQILAKAWFRYSPKFKKIQ